MRRFVFATTVLLAGLPGQKPTAPNATAAYLPMAPGAEWVYEMANDRNTFERRLRCVRPVDAPKGAGRCWEVRVRQHKHRSWEYWGVRKDGIYKHENQYLGPMRGVSGREPTRLIPGPIGATTKWKWTEIGSVQTAGGGSPPSDDELRMQYEGRLVAMAEKVKVPAGEFTAVRIEIAMQSEWFGNSTETLWLARGTGIVKRIVAGAHQTYTYSLTRYTAGRDPNETPQQRIDALLAKDPRFAGNKRPKRVVPVRNKALARHLGSAFYYGRTQGEVVMFRDYEGRTTVFDPRGLPDWNRLITEEFGKAEVRDVGDIGRGVALLNAYHRRPTCQPEIKTAGTNSNDAGRIAHIRLTFNDGTGRRVARWSRSWFDKKGKLTKLEF